MTRRQRVHATIGHSNTRACAVKSTDCQTAKRSGKFRSAMQASLRLQITLVFTTVDPVLVYAQYTDDLSL